MCLDLKGVPLHVLRQIRSALDGKVADFFMTLNFNQKLVMGTKLTFKTRCQRLNAVSREYEEVEVEVPSPIYETIKLYNHQEMQQGGADLIFGLTAILLLFWQAMQDLSSNLF